MISGAIWLENGDTNPFKLFGEKIQILICIKKVQKKCMIYIVSKKKS